MAKPLSLQIAEARNRQVRNGDSFLVFVSAQVSLRWIFALLALALPALLLSYGTQPPPPNHTGGFGEATCTECHGPTNAFPPPNGVTIGAPSSYTPGQSYQVPVTITDNTGGRGAWGFEMSARFGNRI